MANEVTRYTFEGDSSSLAAAVRQAIELLSAYSAAISKASKEGKFEGQAKNLDHMQASLRAAITSLKKLSDLSDSVGNVKMSSAAWASMQQTLIAITAMMQKYDGATRMTDADMAKMSATLGTVAQGFSKVYQAVFSTVAPMSHVASTASQAGATIHQALSGAAASTTRMRQASQSMKASWSGLATTAKGLGSAFQGIASAGTALGRTLGQLIQQSNQASNSFNVLGNSSRLLRTLLMQLGAVSVGKMLTNAISESVSYVENLNLFNVAMRESIAVGREYVDQLSEVYGMDPSSMMRHIGLFYQLAAAMDAPQKASEQFSLGLTAAGVDIASVFNMNVEKVMDNLVAGMQGMTRAVRKYGIDIRVSTLQQEAYMLGLRESILTMSEANRQGLRYIAMIKQMGNLQGDFAKTIESPANQLRVLTEQVVRLARAIGNFFIPMLTAVLPYINAFIMALRMLLEGLAAIIGFKPMDFGGSVSQIQDVQKGVGGVGKAADASKKKLQQMLAPFDQLNILQKPQAADGAAGGGGGGLNMEAMDPRIIAEMEKLRYKMQETTMKANELRDALLKFAGLSFDAEGKVHYDASEFEENLKTKWPQWSRTIEALFRNWVPILEGVKRVLRAIADILWEMTEPIRTAFSAENMDPKFAAFLDALPVKLNEFAGYLEQNKQQVADWATGVLLAFGVFKVVGLILPGATALVNALRVAFAGATLATMGWALAIAGVLTGFAYLYTTNEEFRKSVNGMVEAVYKELKPAIDAVGDMFKRMWQFLQPIFKAVWDALLELWQNHFSSLVVQLVGLVGDIIEAFAMMVTFIIDRLGWLSPVFVYLVKQVQTVFGMIADILRGAIMVFRGVITFLTGVFSGDWQQAWEGIKLVFVGIWTAVKGIFVGVFEQFKLVWDSFKATFKAAWESFWKGISKFFEDIFKGIGKAFENTLNAVSKALSKFNVKMPQITVPPVKVQGPGAAEYASGGLPPMGQMFIAREAGPELVGTIGNRSAVVNNEQIVAAVAKGVADAVTASNQALVKALTSAGGASGETTLVIDSIEFGRVIKKAITQVQRQTGASVITI